MLKLKEKHSLTHFIRTYQACFVVQSCVRCKQLLMLTMIYAFSVSYDIGRPFFNLIQEKRELARGCYCRHAS